MPGKPMNPLNLIDEAIKVTDEAISQLEGHEHQHKHDSVFKAGTDEPDFKVDSKLGEGEATNDELQYRQDLQDMLKQVWNQKDKLDNDGLHELIDKLFLSPESEGKQLATTFLTTIFTTNAESMIPKLKKLGIEKKVPKSDNVLDALIDWQCFAIEKMGMELYYGILNQRYAKTYFEAAYGNPKEKKN